LQNNGVRKYCFVLSEIILHDECGYRDHILGEGEDFIRNVFLDGEDPKKGIEEIDRDSAFNLLQNLGIELNPKVYGFYFGIYDVNDNGSVKRSHAQGEFIPLIA